MHVWTLGISALAKVSSLLWSNFHATVSFLFPKWRHPLLLEVTFHLRIFMNLWPTVLAPIPVAVIPTTPEAPGYA